MSSSSSARGGLGELNGEPMTSFGEVIADIGLIGEHMDRTAKADHEDAADAGGRRRGGP